MQDDCTKLAEHENKQFDYLSHCSIFSALIGAGLLYVIVPYENHGLLGVTQTRPVSPLVGFGVELLMTFVVTVTVLTRSEGGHRTVDQSASVVIGLAVTVCHLFGVMLLKRNVIVQGCHY